MTIWEGVFGRGSHKRIEELWGNFEIIIKIPIYIPRQMGGNAYTREIIYK